MCEILKWLYSHPKEDCFKEINTYIAQYNLSKTNQDGYLLLREDYNKGNKSPMKLYTLICYSFNNQIRFNRKGEYNVPFGKNRSSFNSALQQKFNNFVDILHDKDIKFYSHDFLSLSRSNDSSYILGLKDFIYCDPPYYNSFASYNENNGWSEKDEKDLLDYLDSLNNRRFRFALSNNLRYDNPLLDSWKDKYNIHYLNCDYSNCNYHKKDKISKDVEVLITNY